MSSQQLIDLLRYINNRRLANDVTPFSLREIPVDIVEKLLKAGHRLAIYGPSELLSRETREIPGVWESGAVYGQMIKGGVAEMCWLWDPDGPALPVRVFKAEKLNAHWSSLDGAAGSALIRLLIPVLIDGDTYITNFYTLRSLAGGERA